MRLRCSGQRRLNDTLLELSVARYRRTGMATIPKLMTPFQIDRGIPQSPREPLSFFRAASRAIVTARSRKRTRGATAAPGDDPKQPFERGGVPMPVLTDDHGDNDADRDKNEKDLGPERKIHVVSSRSPAPRVRSGSSRST